MIDGPGMAPPLVISAHDVAVRVVDALERVYAIGVSVGNIPSKKRRQPISDEKTNPDIGSLRTITSVPAVKR
jgi:hypothetical protein